MTHDPKLVEAIADEISAPAGPSGPVALAQIMLTALCAHLRLTPEALTALADGSAVVVPVEATEQMDAAGWIDKEDVAPRDIYRAMLAASPYAREARDA